MEGSKGSDDDRPLWQKRLDDEKAEENPGNEVLIAKASGPEPLVRLLATRNSAQAYALWALSLSIDVDNQKVVSDTGGIGPLVELLSSAPSDLQVGEQAACAIQRLATNK